MCFLSLEVVIVFVYVGRLTRLHAVVMYDWRPLLRLLHKACFALCHTSRCNWRFCKTP